VKHRIPILTDWAVPTLVLALLSSVPPAAAIVAVKRSFPELVDRAEQIIIGTVQEVTEGPDDSGSPATFVTLGDLDVLKGDVGSTLTLRLYGGRMGDRMVRIPDMPRFTVGERYVLFIAGNGRDLCPLVGVWQGRFHVRFDAGRGTEVVEDDAHQPVTGLAGRELQRAPLAAGLEPASGLTPDQFRQLINDELAHPQPNGTTR
jgi:hypothetical protein